MNNTTRLVIHSAVGICLLLLSAGGNIARAQSGSGENISVANTPELKQILRVGSETTTTGSRVTLTFNGPIGDYGAYRNGDKFLVLLPGAELALSEIVVKGNGFSNSKVEARGTNLAFSFVLEADVAPSVSENGNQLEVVFKKRSAGAVANHNDDNGTDAVAAERPTVTSENAVAEQPAKTAPTVPATAVKPQNSFGQPTGSDKDNISLRQADLSVPESPAFTVLGVTPETVVRPTTPREFATSLLNGVDQRGNFQTGLALDFVPFLTFFGDQTSLYSYRHSRMERFLARTQVSFATTKGASEDDKSARLALGLRMTVWDKGDPRLDEVLDTCYKAADAKLAPLRQQLGESEDQHTERLKKRKEALLEIVKTCNDDARKRNWNASGWIVGAAPSWISESGETTNYHWNGGGVWTSLAYGFENVSALKDSSQLIFHARYRTNEMVPDPEKTGEFLSQDSLFLGGRLRIAPGAAAKTIFSLEGNFVRARFSKEAFDNSSRFSLGFEQRIAENIWFSLSLGGQSGRADGRNNAFVLSAFRWGFDQKK
jgi:hypothetical protein